LRSAKLAIYQHICKDSPHFSRAFLAKLYDSRRRIVDFNGGLPARDFLTLSPFWGKAAAAAAALFHLVRPDYVVQLLWRGIAESAVEHVTWFQVFKCQTRCRMAVVVSFCSFALHSAERREKMTAKVLMTLDETLVNAGADHHPLFRRLRMEAFAVLVPVSEMRTRKV
jgi:hypothetical protein